MALALLSYFSTNASPLVDLANTITSPFRAVCTSVSGWFTDKQNYYEDVTALKAENEALKKQIAEMEATVRQGEAASQENVFLRDLLDLRQQRRDLSDFETATVTERSVTNWTVLPDAGQGHGPRRGDRRLRHRRKRQPGGPHQQGGPRLVHGSDRDRHRHLPGCPCLPDHRTSALPAAISP